MFETRPLDFAECPLLLFVVEVGGVIQNALRGVVWETVTGVANSKVKTKDVGPQISR